MSRREEEGISGGRLVNPAPYRVQAGRLVNPAVLLPAQEEAHNLSASIAGISADAYNKITDCWFTVVGQSARVTSLPTGTQFDIHVKYVATKAYITSRLGKSGTDWVVDICAVEPTAKIALWDYDTTKLGGTSAAKELILNKNNIWTNPAVVGESNLNFTIYLLGSWDATLFDNLPTPEELMQMPVQ